MHVKVHTYYMLINRVEKDSKRLHLAVNKVEKDASSQKRFFYFDYYDTVGSLVY